MTTTKRRSPMTSINQSVIDQANLALQQLPEKPKEIGLILEALDRLQSSINAALSKGHSLEAVATILTNNGLESSRHSLEQYLADGKKSNLSPVLPEQKQPEPKPSPKSKPATTVSPEPVPMVAKPTETDLPKTKPSRKRGVEDVMSYLLDESEPAIETNAATERRAIATSSVEAAVPARGRSKTSHRSTSHATAEKTSAQSKSSSKSRQT